MWFPTMRDDFDLFDDMFSVPMFGREPLMRTDVYEKDGQYVMEMDLPGYDKNDVKISLENGSLTVAASRNHENSEKDEHGNVLRQERFSGSCSRSFYVGKNVKQEDVHASFHDGTLRITVPSENKQIEDNTNYIRIE